MKLKCDEPLSNAAFKFNLRRYKMEKDYNIRMPAILQPPRLELMVAIVAAPGRGLHSSTSQLNLSRVCHSKYTPNTP